MMDLFREELLPAYFGGKSEIKPHLAGLVLEMAEKLGPDVFIRQSRALHLRRDQLESLASIRCPVLLVAGEHDPLCPVEYHQLMAEHIPGARLEVIPGCAHLSAVEQPEQVNKVLGAWLRQEENGSVVIEPQCVNG